MTDIKRTSPASLALPLQPPPYTIPSRQPPLISRCSGSVSSYIDISILAPLISTLSTLTRHHTPFSRYLNNNDAPRTNNPPPLPFLPTFGHRPTCISYHIPHSACPGDGMECGPVRTRDVGGGWVTAYGQHDGACHHRVVGQCQCAFLSPPLYHHRLLTYTRLSHLRIGMHRRSSPRSP